MMGYTKWIAVLLCLLGMTACRQDTHRFRIGVGHPKDGHTVIEHVLGRPYGEEIERIEAAKKYTADSVERALETTVDKAMNEFNPKRGR